MAFRPLSILNRPADTPLPSEQYDYKGLDRLSEATLHARREGVFLLLAGLFLGSLTMLNILGISRFIVLASLDPDEGFRWGQAGKISFAVAIGVLPYPVTFLCTDFISELYGKTRASLVVWIGLLLNVWVIAVLWVGGAMPGFETLGPDGKIIPDMVQTMTADGMILTPRPPVFFEIRALAFGAVAASMIAYLAAQLVDVHVFHFWKRVTKGKHLWLRNNGSTLVSQLIDTVAVILITYLITHFEGLLDQNRAVMPQLLLLILTGYVFKCAAALLDTIPFYLGVPRLSKYLRLDPPGTERSENRPGASH